MNTQEKEMIKISENFQKACKVNSVQEIKSIVESSDKALINSEIYNDGFIAACNAGSIEVAQFLYRFSTPSEFALKDAFRCACDMLKVESIKFLVEETTLMRKDVKEYITETKTYNPELYQDIQQIFKNKYSEPSH